MSIDAILPIVAGAGAAVAVFVLSGFVACLAMLAQVVSYRSPIFAVNVAADILGFVALMRPAIRWPVPERIRRLGAWERRGALYRMIGVPMFGAIIRRPPLSHLNSMVYADAHDGALATLRTSLIGAEGAHIWALVLTAPLIVGLVLAGWWSSLAWVIAFNVVLNFYPIFHLRSVRSRVERLLARGARPQGVSAGRNPSTDKYRSPVS